MIKEFKYFLPKTVEAALTLLTRYGEESKIIAGGQSLLILMRQGLLAPKYLIDIKNIPSLDYISLDKQEGLKIGALCTHRAIEKSPVVRDKFRLLADMESKLASVQTRNWGTIGGSLFQGPAGDPTPVLIILNGKLKITGLSQERIVAAEELDTGYRQTVLEQDEVLTEIQVPKPPPYTGTAYTKFTKREGDMAIAGVAVSITLNPANGTCTDARIALGAVAPTTMRAKRAEEILVGKEIKDNRLEQAASAAAEEAEPISDVRGSAEYRRELIMVLIKRVTREALAKAKQA